MSIIYSPERQFELELLLKFLVFWNVAVSMVPAMLVFINLEEFEVPSHQVEYANGCAMALVDMLMALQLFNSYRRKDAEAGSDAPKSGCAKYLTPILLGVIPLAVAASQLAVYNGMGLTEDGEHKGETAAHYLEFAFEMISSIITFWFCMDNKLRVDTMRLDIMLAPEGTAVLMVDKEAKMEANQEPSISFVSAVPRVTRMTIDRMENGLTSVVKTRVDKT